MNRTFNLLVVFALVAGGSNSANAVTIIGG